MVTDSGRFGWARRFRWWRSPWPRDRKKVYVVHGRNVAARAEVHRFLRTLGLEPLHFDTLIIGAEPVGNVVLRAFEKAWAWVVLFTPDEVAALTPSFRRPEEAEAFRWQARPNVLFEAGIAFATARERTTLVTLGDEVALFSDVEGVHVLRLTNAEASRAQFRTRLISMGCDVNESAEDWKDKEKSGDFEECVMPFRKLGPQDPFDRKVADPVVQSYGLEMAHKLAVGAAEGSAKFVMGASNQVLQGGAALVDSAWGVANTGVEVVNAGVQQAIRWLRSPVG